MASNAANLDYAPAERPAFDVGVWLKLCVMMFLQFAVWGAWAVVLGRYLDRGLGFSPLQIGNVYGTMALGAIFSMMVAGQLADRVMSSEYLMAIFHLIGAVLLFLLTKVTGYGAFWVLSFIYALVYNPTLAVANSLAFANIKDSTHFAWVRVFGTIGWIAAGLSVDFLLPRGSDVTARPLMLAAGLSVALGLFSFLLPHTPPSGKAGDALPFLRAFKLLRDPSFGIFFGISFAITIALAFYYGFTGIFLGEVGVQNIATTMSYGQMAEIGFMVLLPFALKAIGMKWVLAVGMAAWAVRYGFFMMAADGQPYVLILLGVLLHGICFDFFLAAGFIHTENKAPAAIRGSAQALFSFLTYGVGMYIGNVISGFVVGTFTTSAGVKNWFNIWAMPAAGATFCLILFVLLWRDKPGKLDEEVEDARGFPIEPVAVTPATIEPEGTRA